MAARKPKEEAPSFTLELNFGELQAVKALLMKTEGLTAQGKILAGQIELKVDELLQNG